MAENIQSRDKTKPVHVLAKLRKVIGCYKQANGPEFLGISAATCASIESGRHSFTGPTIERVSSWAGISAEWLLNGDADAPMMTMGGKPFTQETFFRVRFEHDSMRVPIKKQGDECFRLYLLLCIKLGRVMLAAADAKDGKFAAWKLRDELFKTGQKYPAYGDQIPGVVTSQTAPEKFSMELQTMLNTGTKPKKLWATILDHFHKELCAIEASQAKAATKKPKGKPAKPPRR